MADRIDDIIALEEGKLNSEQTIALFQEMINDGTVWSLQGFYGRTAMDLIESGQCILGEHGNHDSWGNYIPSRFEVKPGTKGSVEYQREKLDIF